jgi:hypothetical protein
MENGGIAPRIRNLGTGWRSVVSFKECPLYFREKRCQYPLDRRWDGRVWTLQRSENWRRPEWNHDPSFVQFVTCAV